MNATTNTTINAAVTTTEEKNTILKWIEDAIAGTGRYCTSVKENKAIKIAINNYGISIGKCSDGSYGIELYIGNERSSKPMTFKSIKDAFIAFKDWFMKLWNNKAE